MASTSQLAEAARRSGFEALSSVCDAVAELFDPNEPIHCHLPADAFAAPDGVHSTDPFIVITDRRILVYRYGTIWTGQFEYLSYEFDNLTGRSALNEVRHPGVDYSASWNKPDIQFFWELSNETSGSVTLRDATRAQTLKDTYDSAFDARFP
ncbi:MAG: hypothetical protein QOE23_691 [Pseudonocardiales bacterium]|jgi:hypothetical protein|nr:hypothetical protein [Pseudonocardiales bacterium]